MKRVTITISLVLFIKLFVTAQSCIPQAIYFTTQVQIETFHLAYPGCTKIEGDVIISGNDITNLNGLEVLTEIGGVLHLTGVSNLVSLSGLDNLTKIEKGISISGTSLITLQGLHNLEGFSGYLSISFNDSLVSIQSLINIDSLSGNLYISNNNALTNLSGLDNITSVSGNFYLGHNDELISLEALDKLKSINGTLAIIWNSKLSSLHGLDSLESEGVLKLRIFSNPLLEVCSINSICEILNSLGDLPLIYNNAPGCNTLQEIEAGCLVTVNEVKTKIDFSIFPNPAKNEIFIEIDDSAFINEINIYNQLGQKVSVIDHFTDRIDISMLMPGIYIIELVTDQSKIKDKLIIR